MTDDGASPPTTLLERLLPPVDQVGPDGHPKPTRMAPREQLVAAGLGFANVAIAAGSATTMERYQGLAILAGVATAVLTVFGARIGNRMVAALGLVACVSVRNSSTAMFVTVGLPYYAAAFWIFLRYNRLTKEQNIRRRQARIERRGTTTATTSTRSGRQGAKAGLGNAKGRPTASKRYTPPKPVKKRPPPPDKPPRDRSIVD